MELPNCYLPYVDQNEDRETEVFDVVIRGESFKITDIKHSLTPRWVSEDMNRDAYGIADLVGLETIVDIGANTGIFSLYASRLYPDAKIFAYEPFELNYKNLVKNIELNGAKNIVPVKMAVTGMGNNISLACPADNSGAASYFHGINIASKNVKSVTLDSIAEMMGSIDLVKMDVESMEYEILWCFTKWEKIVNLSVELHGLFPYPKLLWAQALQSFANALKTKPIRGKLWINDLDRL